MPIQPAMVDSHDTSLESHPFPLRMVLFTITHSEGILQRKIQLRSTRWEGQTWQGVLGELSLPVHTSGDSDLPPSKCSTWTLSRLQFDVHFVDLTIDYYLDTQDLTFLQRFNNSLILQESSSHPVAHPRSLRKKKSTFLSPKKFREFC